MKQKLGQSRALVVGAMLAITSGMSFADTSAAAAPTAANDAAGKSDEAYQVGPFKVTGGPDDNGNFSTVITGGYGHKLSKPVNPCLDKKHATAKYETCLMRFWVLDLNVDAGWHSGSNNKNNSTIELQPTYDFEWYANGVVDPNPDSSKRAACDAAIRKALSDAGKSPTDDLAIKAARDHADECYYLKIPGHGLFALSVYPDVQYRLGHVTVDNKQYDANQIIYGGGGSVFLTAFPDIFATWPMFGAGYYRIQNNGHNDPPAPDGIQDRFLQLQTEVDTYIPGSAALTGTEVNSILAVKLTASKPLSGGNKGWETSRLAQLIVPVKGSNTFKAAVSYRSGTSTGLTYDRQLLIGVLMDFFNSSSR